jgi:hypothetical protein
MKLFKMAIFIMAAFSAITVSALTPLKTYAVSYGPFWKSFWEKLGTIILKAFELYLETVIKRGYFRVVTPGAPIINAFNNEAGAAAAAANGLIYEGRSLTVPEDIVIYIQGDVGVALQKGDYALDDNGNFSFNLVKVLNPVPSPTFPIPVGTD